MSLPPRLPKAQQDMYARIPADWQPIPKRINHTVAGALKARGLFQTQWSPEEGAEWRRTPEEKV